MRIYYQTGSVLVTERVIQVSGRPARRIDEFDDIYVVDYRGTESPRWTVRRLWPAAIAVLGCVVVAVHDVASGGGAPLLVPASVLVACAVMLFVSGRSTEFVNELWAVTKAGHVCLLRSQDKHTFDQIRRAVVRAREGGRK